METRIYKGKIPSRYMIRGGIVFLLAALAYFLLSHSLGIFLGLVGIIYLFPCLIKLPRKVIIDQQGIALGKENIPWDDLQTVNQLTYLHQIQTLGKKFKNKLVRNLEVIHFNTTTLRISDDWLSTKDYDEICLALKERKEIDPYDADRFQKVGPLVWIGVILVGILVGTFTLVEPNLSSIELAKLTRQATALSEQGKHKEALVIYNKIVSRTRGKSYAYNIRANHHMRMKNYGKALSDVEKSLVVEPQSPIAIYIKSICHLQLDQQEQALETYNEIIRLRPAEDSYMMRFRLLARQGKFAKALADLNKASTYQHPNRFEPYKAQIFLALKLYPEANEAINLNNQTAMSMWRAFLHKGLAHYFQRNLTLSHRTIAIGRETLNTSARLWIWEDALFNKEELRPFPQDTSPWQNSMLLLYRGQGSPEDLLQEAKSTSEYYLRLEKLGQVYFYQALREDKKGNHQLAKKLYQKCLEIGDQFTIEAIWSRHRLQGKMKSLPSISNTRKL